jgi:hypothetical protein
MESISEPDNIVPTRPNYLPLRVLLSLSHEGERTLELGKTQRLEVHRQVIAGQMQFGSLKDEDRERKPERLQVQWLA